MHNKLLAAGVGLFGYGALIGWALTADRYEQKMRKLKRNQEFLSGSLNRRNRELSEALGLLYNDVADEEQESEPELESAHVESEAGLGTRETSQEIIERMRNEAISNGTYDPDEPVAEEFDDEDDTDEEEYSPEKTAEIRANLQGLIDQYTGDEDEVNRFADVSGKTMERNYTPPFVISREKYSWDEEEGDDYSKLTLTYYPNERILLDDDDEIIDDVQATIGWRSLNQFGGESGDPEVVFVRNRRLSTDFEVVRDTENQPPAHVRYGMPREEFEANKAAGLIRFRPGDV